MGFWEGPQGAAIFKHAVLERYVPIFASKVGSRSSGKRVGLLDGYAGKGWYDDETPGSGALMVATAEKLSAKRDIHCWFVEADAHVFDDLKSHLGAIKLVRPPTLLRGEFGEHLATILIDAGRIPLFAFVDPFGIGLAFKQLVGQLLSRDRSAPNRLPTEVLVTFVHAGIYRNAGKLSIAEGCRTGVSSAQRKNAAAIVCQLDANLGGPWWREVWRSTADDERVSAIRAEYVCRVLNSAGPGWECFEVAVPDSWGHKPIYDLMLFTRSPHGMWAFNESVSGAREVFQKETDPDSLLVPQLWEPEEEWIEVITSNMRRLMAQGRSVRVIDHVRAVYGDTIGFARGKHVKRAAKKLAENAENRGDCKVNPDRLVLVPTAVPQIA